MLLFNVSDGVELICSSNPPSSLLPRSSVPLMVGSNLGEVYTTVRFRFLSCRQIMEELGTNKVVLLIQFYIMDWCSCE